MPTRLKPRATEDLYGGFWIRAFALFIDCIILMVPSILSSLILTTLLSDELAGTDPESTIIRIQKINFSIKNAGLGVVHPHGQAWIQSFEFNGIAFSGLLLNMYAQLSGMRIYTHIFSQHPINAYLI